MTARSVKAQSAGTMSAELTRERNRRVAWAMREVRKNPFYALAALVLVAAVALAIFGPLLPLRDPQEQMLTDRLLGPMTRSSEGHLYIAGTDNLGRDILSRTIHGARLSIGIAATAAIIAGLIGTALGTIAAYKGGLLDMVMMRLVDLQMAFPPLVLAIFLLYILGSTVTNLVILLIFFSWAVFARMARAQTLSIRNQPFVEGALALGADDRRIITWHIVPHIIPVMAVVTVFDFAGVMLAEAGLSFLGLGVLPPDVSWGMMLSQGRDYINTGGWWLLIFPGLALSLTCLSANLTSRWLQVLTRIQG